MKQIAVIYDWPDSQICMDCIHARFLNDEEIHSAYICLIGCEENDGTKCPNIEIMCADDEQPETNVGGNDEIPMV